jgi:hypothetical protein
MSDELRPRRRMEQVIINDPSRLTHGESVYVLARAGCWLLVSWYQSEWAKEAEPFVIHESLIRETSKPKKADDEETQ